MPFKNAKVNAIVMVRLWGMASRGPVALPSVGVSEHPSVQRRSSENCWSVNQSEKLIREFLSDLSDLKSHCVFKTSKTPNKNYGKGQLPA